MPSLPFQSSGWHGLVANDAWAKLFQELDAWLAANPGKMVVHYDSRDVRRIETPLGVIYLKDIRALTDAGLHRKELFSWLKWVCRPSRALETWEASQALLEKGFLCPQPVLAVRRRVGGIPQDIFVSAEVPLPNLWDVLPDGFTDSTLAEFLADELRSLHQAGFVHGDCILRNLCFDGRRKKLVYLDNDRTWRPPAILRKHLQRRNLAQMAYSILKRFGEEASRHFLEHYAKAAHWPSGSALLSILAAAQERLPKKRQKTPVSPFPQE